MSAQKASPQDDSGPGENDLVIRDGFPALLIPGSKSKPMVDGEEPIPRHKFWSEEDCLEFVNLMSLQSDCETVFTARDKPNGEAYSVGQTFFLPATQKPRCALEGLVQSIFQKHVEHLEEGAFNPKTSGAEWWTLVLNEDVKDSLTDEEDEVGLHFDADYELEDQCSNMLLHPRVATVTYLSTCGAPTLVVDKQSPPMDDLKKKTLEDSIQRAWLSHPAIGRHTAFDGRLLHGAPALYFPSLQQQQQSIVDPETDEPSSKKPKIERKRYTILVNIWLNHWVLDAALLDEDVCKTLKTPWEDASSNQKGDPDYKVPFRWKSSLSLDKESAVSKVALKASTVDPAGLDAIALCNYNVTVKYNPLMQECHDAAFQGGAILLDLEKDAITLEVGDELPDASDADEEEEEGGNGDDDVAAAPTAGMGAAEKELG